MLSRNAIHPLPRDGNLSVHINGDYDQFSRHQSSFRKDRLGFFRQHVYPKHRRILHFLHIEDLPSSNAEKVFSSHCYPVRQYMESYCTSTIET